MFENAGAKIQGLAIVLFWLTLIAGVIAGIAMVGASGGLSLLFIPAAFVGGWVNSIILCAFGELCENMMELNSKAHYLSELCEIVRRIEQNPPTATAAKTNAPASDELPDL